MAATQSSDQPAQREPPWTLDRLRVHLERSLARLKPRPRSVVLAFSGGADSAALLLGLLQLHNDLRPTMFVVHVDHAWDPRSASRARAASELAQRLAQRSDARIETTILRAPNLRPEESNNGLEADSRRIRYKLLERARLESRAEFVLTAHHDDDQLETLILRLRQGTGILGLAAIQRQHRHVYRPLLALPHPGDPSKHCSPGPSHASLRHILNTEGVRPIEDPSNTNLGLQRNWVRHQILPQLGQRDAPSDGPKPVFKRAEVGPEVAFGSRPTQPQDGQNAGAHRNSVADRWRVEVRNTAQRVALQAHRVRHELDRWLARQLNFRVKPKHSSLDLSPWLALDPLIQDFALDALHRSANLTYPASRHAKTELRRQIHGALGTPVTQPLGGQIRCNRDRPPHAFARVNCHCGSGWSWKLERNHGVQHESWSLKLLQSERTPHPSPGSFTYTLSIPGTTTIPDLGVQIEAHRAPQRSWMRNPWLHRVALFVPRRDAVVTVRNRIPGDRCRPFGSSSQIKLKKLLIDRKVPRAQRDFLPIVCIDGEIAWIAGVSVMEPFKLPETATPASQSLIVLSLTQEHRSFRASDARTHTVTPRRT